MPDRFDDVAGAGLALRADEAGTFGNAAERLAQVGGAADERNGEGPLVDVVGLVGRGEHLALVDVVDAEGLEDLGLGEVADAGLGHDRDGDGLLDRLDHLRVGHAGHAAVASDVRGDPLEGHHGRCSGVLGDACLPGVDDIHDDAALEHLGEPALDQLCSRGTVRFAHAGESTAAPGGPSPRKQGFSRPVRGPSGRRGSRPRRGAS